MLDIRSDATRVDRKGLEMPERGVEEMALPLAYNRNAYLVVTSPTTSLQTVCQEAWDAHLQSHGQKV